MFLLYIKIFFVNTSKKFNINLIYHFEMKIQLRIIIEMNCFNVFVSKVRILFIQ